jgi:uncharacterized alpha-E superfamily protein
MARYAERAENVARFIDVNLNLMLDAPDGSGQQWQPLVNTTGDQDDFAKRFDEATLENVIQFLTFDRSNPNSIISCLRAARENGRSVREIISSEMWLQLNKFYLMVNDAANRKGPGAAHEFFTEVKLASHLFSGVTDGTMTRGEAWHWCRLGQSLERADKTSRLLDVKYFILLRAVSDVGTTVDDIQWAAMLRSASAFEMYRKKHGRIIARHVVEFLLLDREFPRAIQWCLICARESLHSISGTPLGNFRYAPEKLLGQLCSDLSYASSEEIIGSGLHEYLDDLQDRINQIGIGISETFFATRTGRPTLKSGQRQVQ